MNGKKSILFLCTGNSCRSQMAEGWAKTLLADKFNAFSAGVDKHGLNPSAVRVMVEAGVDISRHTSKTTAELRGREFDYVVTVCDNAREACPYFPAKIKNIHRGFDDPPLLAKSASGAEEALNHYRRVRDEIRDFIGNIEKYLV